VTWAIALLCIAAAYFILCWYGAGKLTRMVTQAVRYTEQDVRKQDLSNGFGDAIHAYETAWKRTPFELERSGAVLSGELIENPADSTAPHKAVIICHGHTVNRYADLKYAALFYRLGYTVIIFDERYFGRSTGRCCTLGQEESRDVAAIIAWTRRQLGKDCEIGLHGESMGAATALMALNYEHPAFVVADCPFADSEQLLRQFIHAHLHMPAWPLVPMIEAVAEKRYGYSVKSVSPIRAVQGSDVPICFMHGSSDTLIPCSASQSMAAVCRNPKSRIFLYDKADHACSIVVDPKGYEERMDAFIRDVHA